MAMAVVLATLGCGSGGGGSGEFSREFEKPDNLPPPAKVAPLKPDKYSDLSPREKRAMKKAD